VGHAHPKTLALSCASPASLACAPSGFFLSFQVEVEAWRAGLWRQAVTRQGLECGSDAAAQLQACFSSTRLELFQFLPGVEVRCRVGVELF
jgi:hypothetical protein